MQPGLRNSEPAQGSGELHFEIHLDSEPPNCDKSPEAQPAEMLADDSGIVRAELPHRHLLERHFGPLGEVEVFTGPSVVGFLDSVGAEAATVGGRILLRDPNPEALTVAHEVVHVLQGRTEGIPDFGASYDSPLRVLESDSAAEHEAEAAARAAVAPEGDREGYTQPNTAVRGGLAPDVVALRRGALRSPSSDSPKGRFEVAVNGSATRRTNNVVEQAAIPHAANNQIEEGESPAVAPKDGTGLGSEVATDKIAPTFASPALPDTALSPEEQARHDAERAAAQEAFAQAERPSQVVGAFADAPPSLKATLQSSVGNRVSDAANSEQAGFAAELPPVEITMGGEIDESEVPPVAAPHSGDTTLEDRAPSPSQLPDLPATPERGAFDGNRALAARLDRTLTGSGPSPEAIASSLDDVRTSDPVETSPGPKPTVPTRPGTETDPDRIDDQRRRGKERINQARDEAIAGVVQGKGPEQAKLKQLDEERQVQVLTQSELQPVAPAEEAAVFQQLELEEEVRARFDQNQEGPMRESLGEARLQTEAAESEQDQARQETLDKAESDRSALVEQADVQQREQVLTARRTIQEERQSTVNAQAKAVDGFEKDSEKLRAEQRGKIDSRIAADEKQISEQYDSAEKKANAQVAQGERDANRAKRDAEREAKNQSWWDRAKNFVKNAFAKLTATIGRIFDGIRATVKGFLDAARNLAKRLIDAAANAVKGLISAFGKALKVMVTALLGNTFPELARKLNEKIDAAVEAARKAVDQVAEDLKSGVDAIVDALQKGLDAILATFQKALNFGLGLLAAALTGDWAAVFRQLLEAALNLLGIDPAAFYAFAAKIMDTVSTIVREPGRFLSNVLDAVALGFQRFGDNFFTHLKAGVIGWLTGALGGNIQYPDKWDIWGVLSLVQQLLGLTWDWLKQRAVNVIGEKNVERLQFLWSYVDTLRTEGWKGLFSRIKDELAGLKDRLLEEINEFLVVQVIKAGVLWLASLFNPVSALIKVVMTVWNIYTFLRDQLARIMEVVKSVVDSLDRIVRGVLEEAALKIESALANLLPVAIDLIAKLLGLTGIAAKVRGILKRVRTSITQSVDRLLRKVVQRFKPKPKAEPAAGPEPTARRDTVAIGRVLPVTVPGQPAHKLAFEISGSDATLVLRSTPKPVFQWLNDFRSRVDTIAEPKTRKNADAALKKAVGILRQLDKDADTYLAGKLTDRSRKKATPPKPADPSKIDKAQVHLRDAVVDLFKIFGSPLATSFEAEVKQAHELVQPDLKRALTRRALELQQLAWPEVREKLATDELPFSAPLRSDSDFGSEVRKHAGLWIEKAAKTENIAPPEKLNTFFGQLSRRVTTGRDDVFGRLRTELQSVMFTGGNLDALQQLEPALREALIAKKDVDALLKSETRGKERFTKFLVAMAEGRSFDKLPAENWETVYWGQSVNRTWIKGRFRDLKGGKHHEWIPTNYIDRIIERGQAAARAQDASEAGRWIVFQNEFRTETQYVIFHPSKHVRTVPYVRDPLNRKNTTEGKANVLQGHVGAIYAPVKDNAYVDNVKQQTVGQQKWHDGLRKIFDSNFSNAHSKTGIRNIIQQITFYIGDTLWFGEPKTDDFPEYYDKSRGPADGKGLLPYSKLKERAIKAMEEIQTDIDRTRDEVI